MCTQAEHSVMSVQVGELYVQLDKNGAITVNAGGNIWRTQADFCPCVRMYDRDYKTVHTYLWKDCGRITQESYSTGYSRGIRTVYAGFSFDPNFSFAAFAEIVETTGELQLGITPICDVASHLHEIRWPGPMEFSQVRPDHYTVYPLQQGILIPNDCPQEIRPYIRWYYDEEQVYSRSAYMPWFGQVREREGYWLLAGTPFDAGFHLDHPAGGPTAVSVYWKSQLGKLGYRRYCMLEFFADCDHNTFCKRFRRYLIRTGELCTLQEKMLKNPAVEKLLGTAVYHTDPACYDIQPVSRYYNNKEPEKNRQITPFAELARRVESLKARGLDRVFTHIDGWPNMGYDNQHPDVFPPCEDAGGWDGLRDLMNRVKSCGYLFALHDQYRDYYHAAPSYDPAQSLKRADGSIPGTDIWYGGQQDFLCPEFAVGYVRRNYATLKENGVILDGTYQDCFSCSILDECYDPMHPVTREQCMQLRKACFDYARSLGIIVSSEEGIGWAMRDLDLVHHAPYTHHAVMGPNKDDEWLQPEAQAISAPLLNLVYHDCIVIPWDMSDSMGYQSVFLHTLLNGGVPYVNHSSNDEMLEKVKIAAKWHAQVGASELLRHEFLTENGDRQRAVFANGLSVEVDFTANTFVFAESDDN